MIIYNDRVRPFSATMSLYCGWCWSQVHNSRAVLKSRHRVSEDKILYAPFFGVPFGRGMGTVLGGGPKDRAFQRAIYRAMVAHSRDAHPWNVDRMVRLGWIKK